MTNEEAISLLCGLYDYHNGEAHELKNANTVMEKLAYAQEKECVKALDVAINALEKQIPKKPNYTSYGDADGAPVWEAECPNCGESLDDMDHHCRCGQAIDWSDGE